jgi:hypothetical protein
MGLFVCFVIFSAPGVIVEIFSDASLAAFIHVNVTLGLLSRVVQF